MQTRTLPTVPTFTEDTLADVPVNSYWIAGYTTPSDPPYSPERTWAQLVVTTRGSLDLTPETAAEIIAKTRDDARDIVVLGPFDTAGEAGTEQRRWLARFPSPIRFYTSVRVQTFDRRPPHPLSVQYAAQALASAQPMFEFDGQGPEVTVVMATVSDALNATFDSAGWVISAFGAVEVPVEFCAMTIEAASVYLARMGSA